MSANRIRLRGGWFLAASHEIPATTHETVAPTSP
jgi:hypothetical protein